MVEAGRSRRSGYGPAVLSEAVSGSPFRSGVPVPVPVGARDPRAAAERSRGRRRHRNRKCSRHPPRSPAGGNGASRRAPRAADRLRLLPWCPRTRHAPRRSRGLQLPACPAAEPREAPVRGGRGGTPGWRLEFGGNWGKLGWDQEGMEAKWAGEAPGGA